MSRKRTRSRRTMAGQRGTCRRAVEMDYARNALLALHFVDAANITWVTTEVGSIAPLRKADGRPHATPTTPPSPEPTEVPTARPRPCPRYRRPCRRRYPTAMCPRWATREGCAPNCLCCASDSGAKYRRPHETFYNEHMEKDFNPAEPDQRLMCDHGFKCVETGGDGQKDGDGTCEEVADYAHEAAAVRRVEVGLPLRPGTKLKQVPPRRTGRRATPTSRTAASRPKWYSINGKNCSKWTRDGWRNATSARASTTTATRRTATSPRPRATKP